MVRAKGLAVWVRALTCAMLFWLSDKTLSFIIRVSVRELMPQIGRIHE